MPATAIALADLNRCLDAFTLLLEGVRPEQWHAPTPCAEWDVRQLLDHVTSGNRMFAALASGERPEGMEGFLQLRARVAPAADDDPVETFRTSGRRLLEIFSDPDFPDGTYVTPIGEQSGAFMIQMRITETLIHGWDLARATGQTAAFPEAIAEQTLASMSLTLAGRPRDPRGFGTEQPVPADAPALDRLAGFVGRAV
ncbi:MAG: TIGR03086 family metal-binding protein [Candidatus Dormibacteria bacterium]|jgi:uncharacterized protein (TIGR03086 family)